MSKNKWRTAGIFYTERTKHAIGWVITFSRSNTNTEREYYRRIGSPSARRCARLLAKIAESEA